MKSKSFKLRNLLIIAILVICLFGCGKEETATPQVSDVKEESTVTEQTTQPIEEDKKEEIVVETTEETAEEVVKEEPKVEMIDWETFATQADNDEICMVVSNESKSFQKVVGTNPEERDPAAKNEVYWYDFQEGDRFAIPIRDKFFRITIDFNELTYDSKSPFIEIDTPKGEICQISIQYHVENGIETKIFGIRK